MKKFLVVALVLGIASLATAGIDLATIAGLSYEVVGGNQVIISSSLGVTGYALALQPVGGEITGAVVPAGFGGVNNPGYAYGGNWEAVAGSVGTAADVVGAILAINFTPGVTEINFVYSDTQFDVSAITVGGTSYDLTGYSMTIPEPATMALLGLGGLFLARRKK